MKKTINIHLGGMPFIIDEDAYNILHNYLESLKAKFTNENERREIIADIEARIAEVFTKRLERRQVVDSADVNYIISQLGKPEDIAGANSENEQTQSQQQTTFAQNKTYTQAGEKKLFRDPDNKIVGGVISGLCQYFGISDPIWVRLATAILFFSFGFGVIPYLLLWILVPEAKTAAEKLQMRGEAVTLDNIQKEVQDTINRANDVFNRSVKDDNISAKIITILLVLLKGFLKIASVIVFIICLFILIAFMATAFGLSMLGLPAFAPFINLFVDSHLTYIIALIAGILTIGIPLFSIMYACARFVLSNKVESNKTVSYTLTALWVTSIATLFIIFPFVARNFSTREANREDLAITQPRGNTLAIASLNDTTTQFISNGNFNIKGIQVSENGFVLGTAEFELRVSKDSLFHIEKVISATGKNKADAQKTISLVNYRYVQTDSIIALSPNIEVFKNAKYRKQVVKNIIYIPAGKKLVFTDENLPDIDVDDERYYASELPNKVFTVKDEKVISDNHSLEADTVSSDNDEAHISINGNGINIHAKDRKDKVQVSISGNGIKVNVKEDKDKE